MGKWFFTFIPVPRIELVSVCIMMAVSVALCVISWILLADATRPMTLRHYLTASFSCIRTALVSLFHEGEKRRQKFR